MLSKKTQYSIYALVKLAREYQKGPILINSIAQSEGIPRKFLENILLDLKNAGILASKKGKGGGYYLIKRPEDVNLADIVRQFDGAISLLPCAAVKFYESCGHNKDEHICGIRDVFREVRHEAYNILRNTSLANILEREAKLLEKK